jgi:hypothetical protein
MGKIHVQKSNEAGRLNTSGEGLGTGTMSEGAKKFLLDFGGHHKKNRRPIQGTSVRFVTIFSTPSPPPPNHTLLCGLNFRLAPIQRALSFPAGVGSLPLLNAIPEASTAYSINKAHRSNQPKSLNL